MSRFSGNAPAFSLGPGGSSNNSLNAILIVAILFTAFRSSFDDKIHKSEGVHFVTPMKFFSKRYDFFREYFKTGLKMLRLIVPQEEIDQNLDLEEGKELEGL